MQSRSTLLPNPQEGELQDDEALRLVGGSNSTNESSALLQSINDNDQAAVAAASQAAHYNSLALMTASIADQDHESLCLVGDSAQELLAQEHDDQDREARYENGSLSDSHSEPQFEIIPNLTDASLTSVAGAIAQHMSNTEEEMEEEVGGTFDGHHEHPSLPDTHDTSHLQQAPNSGPLQLNQIRPPTALQGAANEGLHPPSVFEEAAQVQQPTISDVDQLSPLASYPHLPTAFPGYIPPLPIFINGVEIPGPAPISNANPNIHESLNFALFDFLKQWSFQGLYQRAENSYSPHMRAVVAEEAKGVDRILYEDLAGDTLDFQGLDWTTMKTTREAARATRRMTYRNYVNRQDSDRWMSYHPLPTNSSFFAFKRLNIRKDIRIAHFQLRSTLTCPLRTLAFYPGPAGVHRLNTASGRTDVFVKSVAFSATSSPVSALDAGCGVLMGGTLNGSYFVKPLQSEDSKTFTEGRITSDQAGITNHIKVYTPRWSSKPVAAIASNDNSIRLYDIEKDKFVAQSTYPFAPNCAALSPDLRLRVVVGDDADVLITDAENGNVLRKLSGHRDYGFSCDWSDDGWTVATGFQDMAVAIWDARRWCNSSGVSEPLCRIKTEMAGARNLKFSPAGLGPRVLVAAEEADYINIIDAQTFSSKQTFDVFAEIGGVAFANDGYDLNILCSDQDRGGLLQLERCGSGATLPGSFRSRKKNNTILVARTFLPEPF